MFFIDAHHHLWSYDRKEYGWIDDSMGILKRDFLPEELHAESGKAAVTGTVAVQARQTLNETTWLLSLAESTPWILGVVGWVDLMSGELSRQLDRFAPHPKLVGIRHVLQDEPDRDFMLQPSFTRGISRLESHRLVYDILIFSDQLEQAARLVSMFPHQKFVLDHMGKPPIREGLLQPWKRGLEQLARHSNVWCKISGLVTEADHKDWTFETLLPYLDAAVQAFGTERLMVGSDWPVCRLAAGYGEVMAIPRRYFAKWDNEDLRKIFYRNAIDCYELELTQYGKSKI
jgi:L-fuconolactonase